MPNPLHNPNQGPIKNLWDFANTPAVPESAIKPVQDAIDSPNLNRSPWEARLRGFGAGALEGLRGLTTPLGIASLAGGMEGLGPAVEAAPEAANAVRGLSSAGRAMGTSAAGAWDVLNPNTAEVMDRMYRETPPVFDAMQKAGAFSGNRTIGAMPDFAARMAPAELTPVGGEATYNAAKAGLKQALPDPRVAAYHRILAAGGR